VIYMVQGVGMAKRLNIYLPEGTSKELEDWAAAQGHSQSSLASFLLVQALERAREDKDFPRSNPATVWDSITQK